MPQAAVCPACGVAVVPGYVRCPKCHTVLPKVRFRRSSVAATELGGTTVERATRFPLGIVLLALALVVIDVYFTVRDDRPAPAPVTAPVATPTAGAEPPSVATAAAPTPTAPPTAAAPATVPDPSRVAGELERSLKRQRLWSTVEVVGGHADVRSGSCGDPAMGPAIAGAAAAFKAAGLTRVRCLEPAGRVVFERAL